MTVFQIFDSCYVMLCCVTGWPKKVSYYQVSPINRIKTVINDKFFINID